MIYITGDVHARMPNNWEQKLVGSEIAAAKEYLRILKKYKLKSTLFINGACLMDNANEVRELLKFDVELGGHTYNNFGHMNPIKSYFYRKIFGCIYGPGFCQKKDIARTKKAFEVLGLEMKSWRTHSYGSNDRTLALLKNFGVKYVSDLLGDTKPFFKEIWQIPINIPVDNVTISYGQYSVENRDVFASCTKGRIRKEEWIEILKERVKEKEKKGIASIFLIHPITMAVLDDFKSFEEIVKFLSKYKSEKISEFKF